MKRLQEYINEWSSPDFVNDTFTFLNEYGKNVSEYFSIDFSRDGAHAFMFNTSNNEIAMGKYPRQYHYVLANDNIDDCNKKMGFDDTHVYARRLEKGGDVDEFYNKYPFMKPIRCGRLWDLRPHDKYSINSKYSAPFVIIGWWEDIDSDDWYKYTIDVLTYYGKQEYGHYVNFKNTYVIGINNNGELFRVDKDNAIKLEKRSLSSQDKYGAIRAIHNANQKAKDEFYKKFRINRDAHNQETKYNHTHSKTEAEYRSIKYQESKNDETTI